MGAFVKADASAGAFALTTPAHVAGGRLEIKKTDTSPNPVTVTAASGTIDGTSTCPLTDYKQSLSLVSDGTDWNVV